MISGKVLLLYLMHYEDMDVVKAEQKQRRNWLLKVKQLLKKNQRGENYET